MLVALLIAILLLREPGFAHAEDVFLNWLLRHSQGESGPPVPLTVVDIARGALPQSNAAAAPAAKGASASALSPLEFALFLQSVLEFQPSVVAFENILGWRERERDQEQVFLDQAMRVPRLLVASELSTTADLDAPWGDIRAFPQVSGKRSDLAVFAGIAHQPNEDLRLISTPGFTNLLDDITSGIRVPLLFLYRGEVIPSFALQAIMLWLRATPAEVKIELGSHILLPQNRRIPLNSDGTILVDPNSAIRAHHTTLNDLLLAAQQRESGKAPSSAFLNMKDGLVLARMPDHPFSPPDLFAATIATIQSNSYLHRVPRVFDCVMVLVLAASFATARKFDRADVFLCGLALTAAYCLIALGMLSRWNLWMPGLLPLGALWISILLLIFLPRPRRAAANETPLPVQSAT